MSTSSLTYAKENEIKLPKSSFVAFRLCYGDIETVSENAKCVLLGHAPDIYLNTKNPGIISSIKKLARNSISKRFKGTISVIHRSIRSGYKYQEGDNGDLSLKAEQNDKPNVFVKSNTKFMNNFRTELKRLELAQATFDSFSDFGSDSEQSVADYENSYYNDSDTETNEEDERDATFNIPSSSSQTDSTINTPPSSYPYLHPDMLDPNDSLVQKWKPEIESENPNLIHNIPHFDINNVDDNSDSHMASRITSPMESVVLSELNEIKPTSLKPENKVTFSPDTRRSSRSKMSIAMPEPTQLNAEEISREIADNEKFRKKIKRIAHNSKGRAKEGGWSLQQKLYNAVLKNYKDGEIIKTDRMLVLVKEAYKNTNVIKFNELENCDVNVYERWAEYVVVLRKTSALEAPIIIQLYDTKSHSERAKRAAHQIKLNRKVSAQFYSSTDKSICLTVPSKRGCLIYILKSRYQTASFRWLYFVQQSIGRKLEPTFNIQIAGVKLDMEITIPNNLIYQFFDRREKLNIIVAEKGYKVESSRMIEFLKNAIIGKLKSKEHVDYIGKWLKDNPTPWFCFKQYDRLEWIHNDSELFFIQHQLLKHTYHLEFQQMTSEPRTVTKQGYSFTEPYPIEGFLSRLNNIAGREISLFRTFHKMLYFFSSSHILFFTTYYRGIPPTPRSTISSDNDIYEELLSVPEIYEKSPFKLDENKHLSWLDSKSFTTYDEIALLEFERRTQQIAKAEGLLDLCQVKEIRPVPSEDVQKPHKLLQCLLWYSSQQDIDNEEIVDAVFEIELVNGRIVKLQAPNRHIRDEWIKRLNELVIYWRAKASDKLNRKVAIRRQNQQVLKINEYGDSNILQEWDTIKHAQTNADPYLQNIGGLAMSNLVLMSGILYQKNKKHSNFNQYFVVLCPGFLLLFSLFTRVSPTGAWRKASYYKHYLTIPISDCYIYSGFATSLDLLDRQKEFDSMNPGHHSLPRLYTDGWKSSEEEPLRCFTLWFGKKRSLSGRDKSTEDEFLFENSKNDMPKNPGLINMIRKLGVTGKSVVFMARSRQEREFWVLKIMTEIDRFHRG